MSEPLTIRTSVPDGTDLTDDEMRQLAFAVNKAIERILAAREA